jgi:hypothetical protein
MQPQVETRHIACPSSTSISSLSSAPSRHMNLNALDNLPTQVITPHQSLRMVYFGLKYPQLLVLLLSIGRVSAQTSTVIVIPTSLVWQDALARCQGLGHPLYPVPATPTDSVYKVLQNQPGSRYWIRRRTGGSCTCLNKNGTDDLVEEAPCGDLLPAFCKNCSHGGDGC